MIKGKYFHTFERSEKTNRKELQYQGRVEDYDPEKHCALVLLYSFWDGSPSGQYLKKVTDDWVFYDTNDAMCEAFIETLPYKDQEHGRKMDAFLRKGLVSHES
jgi:hypothetical protein